MHAYMVIPKPQIKKDVMRILAEHIVFQEKPQLGLTDRLITLLSHLIPDDEEDVPAKIHLRNGEERKVEEIKDTLASFFRRQKKTSPSRP